MIDFEQHTPSELAQQVARRVRTRRKQLHLTQEQLAKKAGMPLATYKRFEQKGLIAFDRLCAIAIALGYEDDIHALFARRTYTNIQEALDDLNISVRKARAGDYW